MGLYLLIPTFIVILVSVLIVRAGAIALRMTGLDEKTSNFQALSAFTRAGFTTRESETIMGHPQRRSIISWLIILGNAGIVAVIVTGTSSMVSTSDYKLAIDIAALVIGIYIIYRLVKYTGFTRRWESLIEDRLVRGRFFGRVPVEHLLHLMGGYGVVRVAVTGDMAASAGAAEGRFTFGGDLVLGIERKGQWLPNPGPQEKIAEGDTLVLYGNLAGIEKFIYEKHGQPKDPVR
jgi:hypothetical protein